jgi:bifunctional DNA-binding transcriptional regulator/antitoxin component of YhaV-PrlF toxin-antitoxin module
MTDPVRNYEEPIRFSATLTREPDSAATFITIPFDVRTVWGTHARVPVKGTINGVPFRGSISPFGGVHYLGVNRDLRELVGIKAGEVVEVEILVDTDPRVIVPPDDFQAALNANPGAQVRWKKLSYSHQREHVEAIEAAKKPDTRQKRIAESIDRLLGRRK